jgi:aspartyl-tRNA synthetase
MLKRTHTCGQLRIDHVGNEVILAGWVNNYRDHGGVIFIDLRDREGLTQVVFHPENAPAHEAADRLRHEDVVAVRGKVLARAGGHGQPQAAPPARSRVDCDELEVLNKAETPPFSPTRPTRSARSAG